MERLIHTTYREPGSDAERDGDAARREVLFDLENYQRPLERVHNSALHAPGVVTGLEVRATEGATTVRVLPGVGITPRGDHVVLVAGGKARIGATTHPVTSEGVGLETTADLTGDRLLTVAWAETFDRDTFIANTKRQTDHTPLLALTEPAEATDEQLVLATVQLDAGKVRDVNVGARPQRAARTERLTLHMPIRSRTGTQLAVDTAVVAELYATPDSQIKIDGPPTGGAPPASRMTLDRVGNLGLGGDLTARSGSFGAALTVAGTLTARGTTTLATLGVTRDLTVGAKLVAETAQVETLTVGGVAASAKIPAWSGGGVLAHDVFAEAAVYVGTELSDAGNKAKLTILAATGDLATQGNVSAAGSGSLAGGARMADVVVGREGDGVSYAPLAYETVGVALPNENLRLQSPQNIVFHTGGNPPPDRMIVDTAGNLTLRNGALSAGTGTFGADLTVRGSTGIGGALTVGGPLNLGGSVAWPGDQSGQHYIRLGGLQICWGYGSFANRGYQENPHNFPVSFAAPPAVTITMNDTGAGVSQPHAAIGAWGPDPGHPDPERREKPQAWGFRASFKNDRQTDHTIYYSWIAIGRSG